jgi:hypothetical protein
MAHNAEHTQAAAKLRILILCHELSTISNELFLCLCTFVSTYQMNCGPFIKQLLPPTYIRTFFVSLIFSPLPFFLSTPSPYSHYSNSPTAYSTLYLFSSLHLTSLLPTLCSPCLFVSSCAPCCIINAATYIYCEINLVTICGIYLRKKKLSELMDRSVFPHLGVNIVNVLDFYIGDAVNSTNEDKVHPMPVRFPWCGI